MAYRFLKDWTCRAFLVHGDEFTGLILRAKMKIRWT